MNSKQKRRRFIIEKRRELAQMQHPPEEIEKKEEKSEEEIFMEENERKYFEHAYNEKGPWKPYKDYHLFTEDIAFEEEHRDSYKRELEKQNENKNRESRNFMM